MPPDLGEGIDGVDPLAALTEGVDAEIARVPAEAREPIVDRAAVSRFATDRGLAPNTCLAYEQRWRIFVGWCAEQGFRALPIHPDALRCYLLHLAVEHRALATIEVANASIAEQHRQAALPSPRSDRLRETLTALRRSLGDRGQRAPISLDTLRVISRACAGDLLAIRDRALLLTTYWARLQRVEASGLEARHVERHGTSVVLRVNDAARLLLPNDDPDLCPVRALHAWLVQRLKCLPAAEGPLFVGIHNAGRQRLRAGKRIGVSDLYRTLRRRVVQAGLDPARFSPHDLRASIAPRKKTAEGTHG